MLKPSVIAAFTAPASLSVRYSRNSFNAPSESKLAATRRCLPVTPTTRRTSILCMSTSPQELQRRIQSVQAAEKIVSALRIVAAARIRAASHSALRTRPFAEELQHVLGSLVDVIIRRNIDIQAVASATPPHALASMTGAILADPVVQKALLDKVYLTLIQRPQDLASDTVRWTRRQPVTVLAVLTADKGFCGPYNKEVLSRAVRRIRELREAGKAVELILVGRTANQFFRRHFPNTRIRYFTPLGRSSQAEEVASDLSKTLLSEFIAGGVERVEIVYTRFVSLISSAPSARTLLPLTPTGIEAVGDELFQLNLTTRNGRLTAKKSPMLSGFAYQDSRSVAKRKKRLKKFYYISDEEAIRLLNAMLPMYVTSQMIRIVREAIASEQASRLAAMTAATDNAREILSNLRTRYNKERQARITKEIIEVVNHAQEGH